jgi:hypothetical protein
MFASQWKHASPFAHVQSQPSIAQVIRSLPLRAQPDQPYN